MGHQIDLPKNINISETKSKFDKYLLLTKFEVCSVSYGPKFMAQA